MIHQCQPPIWVQTPLGEGHCLFLFDYGNSINSIWLVHIFETGRVVHIDSSEIRVMGNEMWGIPFPEQPTRVNQHK